ncbi:ribosome maturation factor RimM [Pseudoalteromonas luteoviolacea]|uniref:Ribosome maturation factor RimM n=1 Tax=Pseudoalteromonas luteoviolacea H33 TaxID=1365251 RepID=A0A167G5H6_9GAMM|nr:ribosome maturation factor RimM [Pseudoalteromonas luteoviolacea]KZN54127.1 16S rRNA-processing protein RimM [Pseudoalteromonas luteoviolacea H33]KZN78342.1 16S rRNA-processing protein RimM [Pseudoalteromonas luteoviolacea H33-S]MBQ4877409.1 ribosome maturation factor RimM [Pseudoalteromonas luteoviolacea]MBQ4906492.1 ribosome maturation factor RimM [Pseudoalteromonas luteoviolacea]
MSQDNTSTLVVGKLGAPYGIKGWLKVHSFTDDPQGIFDFSPWLIGQQGKWQALEVSDWRRHSKGFIAKFANINDRDEAMAYTNAEIAVNSEQLPELPEGEFYWRDLIGMTVVTNKGYNLGHVDDLMETGSNDVLVVKANKKDAFGQTERLIPFLTDSVIVEVKHEEREITVDWDPAF